MGKNDLDGQLNLFGNDPYQPKKAKASEEQVELSTEAEEFLAVGRKKKKPAEEKQPEEERKATEEKQPAKEKKAAEEKQPSKEKKATEEKQPTEEKKAKTVKPKTGNKAGTEAVVMQQSFCDASGRTITVAYVDYNCVYVEEVGGKATLTKYPDAKTAVDRYLENVSRLSKTDGFAKSKEHPALRYVECKMAE